MSLINVFKKIDMKNKSRVIKTSFFAVFICTALISFIPMTLLASNAEMRLKRNHLGEILLPDNSIYSGNLKDGLFDGIGKLKWPDGSYYEGRFTSGLMHGVGHFKMSSGSVYQGEMKEGAITGKGIIKFTNGDKYTGYFNYGHFDGYGEYILTNGSKYKGTFKDGNFSGKGVYDNPYGDTYDGLFINGEATGMAKVEYKDGSVYTGNLNKWLKHGNGEYRTKDGIIYTGKFVDGEMEGKGEIDYTRGNIYKGDIKSWRGHGKGKIIIKGKIRYTGEFDNGLYHGQGTLTYKSGNLYVGEFEKGMRHGKGIYTRKNPKGRKKQLIGWWEYDDYISKTKLTKSKKSKKSKPINAEAIFYKQHKLLNKKLSNLKSEIPSEPDLYMLGFGSTGYQDVFMNEVKFAKHYFDMKLGTRNRSIELINNHKTVKNIPLASVSNLKISLNYLANVMNKEQDILFLFLTSHGSKKHELNVSLRGLPLNDLPAKNLASLLKKTKIKWKVIVISACYSGGFIKELKDDYTMIMTASKSDHVSFGCSDEAEFTYFGRAFFKEALPQSKTFLKAFERAKNIVTKMEDKEKYSHSEPQIYTTPKIEAQLRIWRKTF